MRLLVVEDNPEDRALIRRSLSRKLSSWTVEFAPEAGEAIVRLAQARYDVVSVDWRLGKDNGLDLLERLRPLAPEAHFVLCTGSGSEQLAVEALRRGFDDYLIKGESLGVTFAQDMARTAELYRLRGIAREAALADRLSTLGLLAAGMGHEINNPLSVVTAGLETVQRHLSYLPDGADARAARDATGDALGACWRIVSIIDSLRALSHVQGAAEGEADLNEAVRSVAALCKNELQFRARLELDLCESAPVVGDGTALSQVVLNLVTNALKAISGRPEDNLLRVETRQAAGEVVLRVRDTGRGIPPEEIERIFLPFYTRREGGDGMGIGLALCHYTVTRLGGRIEVESRVGEGSTFTVSLPRPVASGGVVQADPRPAVSSSASRRMRVLVVDDEQPLLRALQYSLRHAIDVDTAQTAGEALDKLDGGSDYDAVVCDLMMPGTSGIELYEQILARRPGLAERTLFYTGGALTEETRRFHDQHSDRILLKPALPGELLAAIERVAGAGVH